MRSGFTLIEVLASMLLLSMILLLASASLSQFSGYSNRLGVKSESTLNQLLLLGRTQEILESTHNYFIKNSSDKTELFFEGNQDRMVFISDKSVASEQDANITFLKVFQSEDDPSLVNLGIVQVKLSKHIFFQEGQLPSDENLDYQVIIANAKDISFEYLGIENIRQLFPSEGRPNFLGRLTWQSSYQGSETGYIPEKVKLNISWADGTDWPCIIRLRAQNYSKRSLMLDATS